MIEDHWRADGYAKHANFVPKLTQEVIQDLAPRAGEKILDVGCGDGVLSKDLQSIGCHVIGIDRSRELLTAARARGIKTILGDAQEMQFNNAFDAVFSNAAMHWMPRQSELASCVHKALKSNGRFVAEMGGAGNIATLQRALTEVLARFGIDFATYNPWTFPTIEEMRAILERSGFEVTKCTLRDRPTLLPTDIRGWFVTFAQALVAELDTKLRTEIFDQLVEFCHPLLCNEMGEWTVDYVRLNFVAWKR